MSIVSSPPQRGGQNSTYLEGIRIWVHEHPKETKILKIAGVILGIGLLAPIPVAIPLRTRIVAGLAVTGIIAICVGKKNGLSIDELWKQLEKETKKQMREIEYTWDKPCCVKKTALFVDGEYLNANKMGEGLAQRSFIASRAPSVTLPRLKQKHETFWMAIFNGDHIICDLTTIAEQEKESAKKYYPDVEGATEHYGVMSVKLVGKLDCLYTYQIKNTTTEAVKNITRYNYIHWSKGAEITLPNLVLLIQKVEQLYCESQIAVPWIHCRAGLGRTGTLITALILKEKITRNEINKKNLDASLVDIILKLRKQRDSNFVEEQQQLSLLRAYAGSLLEKS